MALVLLVMAIRCFVVHDIRGVYADLSGKARQSAVLGGKERPPHKPVAHFAKAAEASPALPADSDDIGTEVASDLDDAGTVVADARAFESAPPFAITQKLVVVNSRDIIFAGQR